MCYCLNDVKRNLILQGEKKVSKTFCIRYRFIVNNEDLLWNSIYKSFISSCFAERLFKIVNFSIKFIAFLESSLERRIFIFRWVLEYFLIRVDSKVFSNSRSWTMSCGDINVIATLRDIVVAINDCNKFPTAFTWRGCQPRKKKDRWRKAPFSYIYDT